MNWTAKRVMICITCWRKMHGPAREPARFVGELAPGERWTPCHLRGAVRRRAGHLRPNVRLSGCTPDRLHDAAGMSLRRRFLRSQAELRRRIENPVRPDPDSPSFTCTICRGTFAKDRSRWSEQQAAAELQRNFNRAIGDPDIAVLCDGCFNMVMHSGAVSPERPS